MIKKCFFCHLSGSKKDKLILEDDDFFSIYDAAPVSPGHAIVVPKVHIVSFFEVEPEFIRKMYGFIVKVKRKIDEEYHPDAYNLGINDGRAAGRSADHLHVHLIPRYIGDVANPRGGIRNLMGRDIPPERVPDNF